MMKTSQIAKLFHKSPMTIGRWVDTCKPYLSHTALSTDATERRFSDEDMRVLTLVWQMREEGNEFELITAALASGERAEPLNPASAITTAPNSQLALQARIADLENQLATANALRHEAEGQVKLLRELLREANALLRG